MDRTLIIYGTRKGTTENTVRVIAETLVLKNKHHVEITNISNIRKFRKRFGEFNNLIIGSSIVSDRWKPSVLRFLKRYSFQDQKIALFVTAGGTMNKEKKYGYSREQARKEAIQKYIDKYLFEFDFSPVDKTAFGGMVIRSGKEKFNSWNRDEIESWAIQLGKLFAGDSK